MVELMDDYNLFLYRNQGKQIQAKRQALGMTIVEYAKHLGVPAWQAPKMGKESGTDDMYQYGKIAM